MSDAPTVLWTGASGQEYKYWAYALGASLKEEAGNYIFAKRRAGGGCVACYIGQTANLNQRLGDHEKGSCASRHGATHVHAHLNSRGETGRRAEEGDLISRHRPACNEQLVP